MNNAVDGSGNSSGGNGSGNPSDGINIEQLVNEAVNKAIGARMKRLDLGTQIESAVQAAIAKATPVVDGTAKPELANDGGTERLSVKALQEKFDSEMKAMRSSVEAERKARADAEQRAKDTSARSELRSKLAAKMGADHPLLRTVMDSLYDAQKRVVESDGRLALKFPGQYGGEDELKSLDEGIESLFAGEFKSLVQQSRAGNLPPASMVRGQQVQGAQPQAVRSAIYDEIAGGLTATNATLAAALSASTPQK